MKKLNAIAQRERAEREFERRQLERKEQLERGYFSAFFYCAIPRRHGRSVDAVETPAKTAA